MLASVKCDWELVRQIVDTLPTWELLRLAPINATDMRIGVTETCSFLDTQQLPIAFC